MIKRCSKCKEPLIPYGDTYLHMPDSKCELMQYINIVINIDGKPYQDAIGDATETFNDIVLRLDYLEKKWWQKGLIKLINWFRRLRVKLLPHLEPEKP